MFWLFQPSASGCNMLNFFGWSIKNQLTVGKLFYSLIYYLRTQQNVQNTLTAIKPEFNYQNLTFSFDFQLQHQNIREMKLELWFWLKNIFWCNTPRWYREGLIRNSLLQCFAANNSLSFGDGFETKWGTESIAHANMWQNVTHIMMQLETAVQEVQWLAHKHQDLVVTSGDYIAVTVNAPLNASHTSFFPEHKQWTPSQRELFVEVLWRC